FEGEHPWLPYHENITDSFSRLVGAKEEEVVAMNTLTVNLHLLMVSFYRPAKSRFKILIENNTFPSDKYAVDSQARFHGYNPREAIVELKPRAGETHVREEDLLQQIADLGDSLAMVLIGNCNYLSGQCFDFQKITSKAHEVGAIAGFNLAHGAGNLFLKLHDWNVDFAVWCSYKYLNAGPGGIAGAFIHERHLSNKSHARFEGWWGQNKSNRFKMGPDFDAIPTAEAWQLSNPPIFQLASLRASMELFDEATMKSLREKGDNLTSYFEQQVKTELKDQVQIVTPQLPHRGSMLCLRFKSSPKLWTGKLRDRGVFVDFREPDIIRATPAPLYNSYEDVYQLVQAFKEVIHES
ncbi:MAG: kynureninase, partial [Bdellovibrionaceae bacterium]|nr:kynureninase [Pseudobdellovibrionaceae bacterium]